MQQLNKKFISSLTANRSIGLPAYEAGKLPEKVLQFGTGVLLRGLPDFYINKANNKNIFNGRIVVVKSTGRGSTNEFAQQDNCYTHCIKGMVEGKAVEEYLINAAISRVIDANGHWKDVLQCAANLHLQIIISNTTEVGIVLKEDDDIFASPPQSFPGKLLAFLYERYQVCNGSPDNGFIIIPTELIVDNGRALKKIVSQLARINGLDESFITWLSEANDWCSSLVDRIVPGALPEEDKKSLAQNFGYTDALAIMSEPYSLWAIETGSERTKKLLSFSEADNSVIIAGDIQKYRELKLRLLNAVHTFCCGLAYLNGFNTVYAAMQDKVFYIFVRSLIWEEIIPCLVSETIIREEAEAFAENVLNRFANPFNQHLWLSIALQYTSKMKARCVPLITTCYQRFSQPRGFMPVCFAAFLRFVKTEAFNGKIYYGKRNEEQYALQDEEAKRWYELWQSSAIDEVVAKALSDKTLWDENLAALPRFKDEVLSHLQQIMYGADLTDLWLSVS